MADKYKVEYRLIGYRPSPFKPPINVGLILLGEVNGKRVALTVRITKSQDVLLALDPGVDLGYFQALEADLPRRIIEAEHPKEFLAKMYSYFSNGIELTPAEVIEPIFSGKFDDFCASQATWLMKQHVEVAARQRARESSSRIVIRDRIENMILEYGLEKFVHEKIAIAPYVHVGEDLKFDYGYHTETTYRLIHAVSLRSDLDKAKLLAFSYPDIVRGYSNETSRQMHLTAVVEDTYDRDDQRVGYVLEKFRVAGIVHRSCLELPMMGKEILRELQQPPRLS